MSSPTKIINGHRAIVTMLVVLTLMSIASANAYLQQPASDTVRDVWPPGFRPQETKSGATPRRDRYRRATPPLGSGAQTTGTLENSALGITIWRLRLAKETDEARILVTRNSKKTPFTPERVEVSTAFVEGQMLRLSVEVPRTGYLYIIDREEYANGTESDPYLIFPLNPGREDHKVTAGQVVEVPNQKDAEAYFEVKSYRGPNTPAQVGEILTVLVTPMPLQGMPSQPGNASAEPEPLKLTAKQVAEWERLWTVKTERLELEGGAGTVYTRAEQAAGSDSGKRLTPGDPLPQTVFRVAAAPDKPLLVKLPLRIVKQ